MAELSWRTCSLAQPALFGPKSMASGRPAAEIWGGIAAVPRNDTQRSSAVLQQLKPPSPSSSSRKHWPSSREKAAVKLPWDEGWQALQAQRDREL